MRIAGSIDPGRWIHACSVFGLLKFFAMGTFIDRLALKRSCFASLLILMLCTAPHPLHVHASTAPATSEPVVPDGSQPGSLTLYPVTRPADFAMTSLTFDAAIRGL